MTTNTFPLLVRKKKKKKKEEEDEETNRRHCERVVAWLRSEFKSEEKRQVEARQKQAWQSNVLEEEKVKLKAKKKGKVRRTKEKSKTITTAEAARQTPFSGV